MKMQRYACTLSFSSRGLTFSPVMRPWPNDGRIPDKQDENTRGNKTKAAQRLHRESRQKTRKGGRKKLQKNTKDGHPQRMDSGGSVSCKTTFRHHSQFTRGHLATLSNSIFETSACLSCVLESSPRGSQSSATPLKGLNHWLFSLQGVRQ